MRKCFLTFGRAAAAAAVATAGFTLVGCAAPLPAADRLPGTRGEARAELRRLAERPVPAARPVLLLGGWGDLVFGMRRTRAMLRGVLLPPDGSGAASRGGDGLRGTGGTDAGPPDPFVLVNHGIFGSFDGYRDRLIARLQRAFPSDEPGTTVPVDVVAHSMGGLLARYAALPRDDGGRRLRIVRLFTTATPHRGARMAWLSPLDATARAMRPGSAVLQRLDDAWPDRDYRVFAYVRSRDEVVGVQRTRPPTGRLYWTDARWYERAHVGAKYDPRIVLHTARVLRGEAEGTPKVAPPLPDWPGRAAGRL